jgi:serine/threonine protein kinase
MKKMKCEEDGGIHWTAIREIAFLKDLRCTNIVRLFDVLYKPGKLTLVFEHFQLDLKRKLEQGALPTPLLRHYLYQLCKGTAYLHDHLIMHRDLKPENLLLDQQRQLLKVADFGLAKTFAYPFTKQSTDVVTLWYRAPELLLHNQRYTPAVDVWSIGCIFVEMATGKTLFRGLDERDQIAIIFRALGTPNDAKLAAISGARYSGPEVRQRNSLPRSQGKEIESMAPGLEPEAYELLMEMLCADPEERIVSWLCLQHQYFRPLYDQPDPDFERIHRNSTQECELP